MSSPDAFRALRVSADRAGHWREALHTFTVLGRIERCLEQLCNVAHVGRHGDCFRVGYEARLGAICREKGREEGRRSKLAVVRTVLGLGGMFVVDGRLFLVVAS